MQQKKNFRLLALGIFGVLLFTFMWCVVDNIVFNRKMSEDVASVTAVNIISAMLWLVGHGFHGAAVIAFPAMILRRTMPKKKNSMPFSEQETARTQARYQRIAPLYDAIEVFAERRYADWRPKLWSIIKGPKVLEVGVGTGKNMPYYPTGIEVTAIDLTPGMLERARARAAALEANVSLQLGDVQNLDFLDNSFDEVVATFVFCSVPDPLLGLDEIARVLKPNGCLHLLEHVRSPNPILGALMDLLDPVTVRLMGPHINRRTVQNVQQSRLHLVRVEDLGAGGIFKLIVARRK